MTVIIPKKAYLAVVAAAVRYANQRIDKDDWLEVSGVFIGKNVGKKKKQDVVVTAAYPIMHQELDKDAVIDQYKWSDEDYEALYLIDDEAFSREEFVVGWWHSHPGFKVMMSHIDIRTTMSYQINNPLAISLVFNPVRLIRQIELPDKKGDPVKQLKDDPGFKLYRLDDPTDVKASYHEAEYIIEGYDNMDQLVKLTQKFIIAVTNFFPKENLFETYEKFVKDQVNKLDSLIMGTEEYLQTLIRKGEQGRVKEVLKTQTQDIRRTIAETFIKIENIKDFMDYLEYKERALVIPKVEEILAVWDERVSTVGSKLAELAKKF